MLKSLTERDVEVLKRLVRRTTATAYNTRLLPVEPEHFGPPPTIYVAYTGSAIPGRSGTRLGTGEVDLFQIIRSPIGTGTGGGTGSGSITPYDVSMLIEMYEIGVLAHNVNEAEIPAGSWVVLGREQSGSWIVIASSSDGGRVLLVVQAGSVTQVDVPGECGGTGTGTGSATGADDCGMVFHAAEILIADPLCQDYTETGECVWVCDILGRRLEGGRLYWADFIGPVPTTLRGVQVPIDPDNPSFCSPDDTSPVYSVDIGTPARTIKVGELVGRLCVEGTGSSTVGVSVGSDENLPIYLGEVFVWHSSICAYVKHEDCLVANAEGCRLRTDRYVTGAFHRMVPRAHMPDGVWPERCLPLYITTDKRKRRPVGDVLCTGGVLKVYFIDDTAGCEEELVYGHDAGCCDCGGTGTATGASVCGFEAVPDCYNAVVSGVTNNGCLDCGLFNTTFLLCLQDGSVPWVESGSVSICAIACTERSLTCTFIDDQEYMLLDLCGAQYRLLLSSWVPFGSNVMDFYTQTGFQCNWPATVTVSPA